MMTLRKLTILITACCIAVLANSVKAQTNCVKVKFEVDGKEVKQKFKVVLYVSDKVIEPSVSETGFTVPPEIKEGDEVKVRFLSGEYDLFFDSLHSSKFGTDWVVGVDNKPFDKENTEPEEPAPDGKELSKIYYIIFLSKKGLDTRLVMKVYK